MKLCHFNLLQSNTITGNYITNSNRFLPGLKKNIHWNPVNKVTNGPKKIDLINGVAILTRFFLQENVWRFLPGAKKSGGNNELTVLPRWP